MIWLGRSGGKKEEVLEVDRLSGKFYKFHFVSWSYFHR